MCSDFTLSYLAQDSEGQEVYLSMLSDWDMDAAFQCAADPCLKLKVDLKPFDQGQLGGKSNVPFITVVCSSASLSTPALVWCCVSYAGVVAVVA